MIGYYVHHQGRGHLQRAGSIAAMSSNDVTVLSSLPLPAGYGAEWVALERDDETPTPREVDAHGRLHWVPLRDAGLRSRMARISAWIAANDPAAMVVDVSVEVALLARLHGVPVVTFALPGVRGDAAHRLGYDVAERVIACWPSGMRGMIDGFGPRAPELHTVGAISRFRREPDDPPPRPGTVLVLSGTGGAGPDPRAIDAARRATPGWKWTVLGGTGGTWTDDPWPLICSADVVVTHAGQNALADVAAAARPAIVVPQDRPHDEQRTTARALAADGDFPVVVLDSFPEIGWASLLERARSLDGSAWMRWNDGLGAVRAAASIDAVAAGMTA